MAKRLAFQSTEEETNGRILSAFGLMQLSLKLCISALEDVEAGQ